MTDMTLVYNSFLERMCGFIGELHPHESIKFVHKKEYIQSHIPTQSQRSLGLLFLLLKISTNMLNRNLIPVYPKTNNNARGLITEV